MVAKRKRHWLWNLIVVLTIVVCILAFVAHYKNWTKIENDSFQILSGVYYIELPFSEINNVQLVDRLPSMERINGFSAMAVEKGVFRDSISENKVYVYVDNLANSKIRLVYQDTLELFVNYADSTKTQQLYELFIGKIDSIQK